MKANFKPPIEIYEVLHQTESKGILLPKSVDKWWEKETIENQKIKPATKKKDKLYIPENNYNIRVGYYTLSDFVKTLRENKNNPDAIQFIADMLEE